MEVTEHILQLDPYPDPVDLKARVSMLNADQRRVYDKITSHLLHLQKHEKQECACTKLKALNMFVSGVGGTGKSFLIRPFVLYTHVQSLLWSLQLECRPIEVDGYGSVRTRQREQAL